MKGKEIIQFLNTYSSLLDSVWFALAKQIFVLGFNGMFMQHWI